jgi:hypothetical protein
MCIAFNTIKSTRRKAIPINPAIQQQLLSPRKIAALRCNQGEKPCFVLPPPIFETPYQLWDGKSPLHSDAVVHALTS